jgi:hypothetical protein
MATVVLLGSVTFTTTGGDKTVVATPQVGDLIIVVAAATGGGPSACTDNNDTGAAYTKVAGDFSGFSTAGLLNVWARTTPIQNAASTTWTSTQTSSTGGGLAVYAVRGAAKFGANAIRTSGGQSSAATGTPAPVMGLVPKNTNPIIAAVASAVSTASATPRSSPAYTEDFDAGYTVPTTGLETSHVNSGETSATITYGGSTTGTFASVAVEIDADTPTAIHPDHSDVPEPLLRRRPAAPAQYPYGKPQLPRNPRRPDIDIQDPASN